MTPRLFYAIMCDKEFVRHVSREHSSTHTESIILDVAPCSATFVNNFIDALNLHTVCEQLYPHKKFYIQPFNY